jgi:hypothetical protein
MPAGLMIGRLFCGRWSRVYFSTGLVCNRGLMFEHLNFDHLFDSV